MNDTKRQILREAHAARARQIASIEELEEKRVHFFDKWCWEDGDPVWLVISTIYEDEIKSRENPLGRVILPIIRKVVPDMIAKELVGVQPMTGPVGQVMTLRHTYGKTNEEEDDNQ